MNKEDLIAEEEVRGIIEEHAYTAWEIFWTFGKKRLASVGSRFKEMDKFLLWELDGKVL